MATTQAPRLIVPKVIDRSVLLFPGQGCQYVGMVRNLTSKGKGLFNIANQVLGYDLLKLCQDGPEEDLNKTIHSQPAIFVSSLAAVEQLAERSPLALEKCIATAGFSMGEYAALVYSRSIDFVDALRLIKIRAEATQEICESIPTGLITVLHGRDANVAQAAALATEYCIRSGMSDEEAICDIATYLFQHGKVIGGHEKALEFVEHNAKDFGITRIKRLAVSGAFHTKFMQPAHDVLASALSKIRIETPAISVYSCVDAKIYTSRDEIFKNLIRHLSAPVMWQQIVQDIYTKYKSEDGDYPYTFECGPQGNLNAMLGLTFKKARAKAFNIEP